MKTKKIPSRALRFNAGLEFLKPTALGAPASAGELADVALSSTAPAPPAPVKLVALSGEIVNHWWFGPCIHDLAGMTPAAAKLPLDYCHDCDEVIGFSDKQDVATGQLVMSGKLVPFTADDRASEVIYKGSPEVGVPYQASIYFDPCSVVIEEVPAGMSTQVNGKDMPGPLTVFRQWQLRGAAVCPYGMDSKTETQFSAKEQDEVEVKVKGEQAAEAAAEAPAEAASEVPAEVKPEEKSATEQAAEEVKTEVAPEAEAKTEEKPAESAVAPTELAADVASLSAGLKSRNENVQQVPSGKDFLTAFGAQGGVWFAEGKTFDEARTLFTKSLQDQVAELTGKLAAKDKAHADEVTALKKTNAEQAALLAANRGEASPMTFTSAEETAAPKEVGVNNLPEGMAKFAASIKIPRS